MIKASIALCSQKGGVGKTSVALNLGLALAQSGTRTTVVELDPQGSIGSSLRQPHDGHLGLAQMLTGERSLDEVLITTKVAQLELLPAGFVNPLERPSFETAVAGPGGFRSVIDQLHARGSEIVIADCPSGLGQATIAGLSGATHALIPVQAEPLCLRTVDQVLAAIEQIRYEANPNLALLGLLMVMVDKDSDASLSVVQEAWKALDSEVVLETVVPRREVFLDASLYGVPVAFMGAAGQPEGRRFRMLADEILDRIAGDDEEVIHGPTQTLL